MSCNFSEKFRSSPSFSDNDFSDSDSELFPCLSKPEKEHTQNERNMLISLFGSDYYSDYIEIKKSETLPQAEECQHILFIKNQIKKFSIGKKFKRKLNGNIEEREISSKKLRQSQQACFVQSSVVTPMNKLSDSSTSELVIISTKEG